MDKRAIDDVPNQPSPLEVHSVRRPISDALEFSDFAMNYFELEPGESFSGGYHTHHDQEEVFYVQSGTATFDTEDGAVVVDAGEVIRFEPSEFQQGYNAEDADEIVVGFAFGAPASKHDWEQIESIAYCRECEEKRGHGLELTDDEEFRLYCLECETAVTTG